MFRIKIVIIAVIMALLAGCSAGVPASEQTKNDTRSEMPYDIVTENGEYYLVLSEKYVGGDTSNALTSELAPTIKFTTMDEMLQDIKTGNFSAEELKQLSKFKTDEDGRTIICDISKLYYAHTPEQYEIQEITWNGSGYSFEFYNGTDFCCYMARIADLKIVDEYTANFMNGTNVPNFNLLSTQQVEDRNATIITYTSHNLSEPKEHKRVYYTIVDGGRELFVHEEYNNPSDTAPAEIVMYGTDDGINFTVIIYNHQERPTVEWLSQFGFREYVETEVA